MLMPMLILLPVPRQSSGLHVLIPLHLGCSLLASTFISDNLFASFLSQQHLSRCNLTDFFAFVMSTLCQPNTFFLVSKARLDLTLNSILPFSLRFPFCMPPFDMNPMHSYINEAPVAQSTLHLNISKCQR